MTAPVHDNKTRSFAESACFLCEAVGQPVIYAGCTNESTITICSIECMEAHGLPVLFTNSDLARVWT